MSSSETVRMISESLPSWLAVASLAAPALGAVLVRIAPTEAFKIKFLEIITKETGRSFPEGRGEAGLQQIDETRVIVPSGAEGSVNLSIETAGKTETHALNVKDMKRLKPIDKFPGWAQVSFDSPIKRGIHLRTPNKEVKLRDGIFVTYGWDKIEDSLR